MRRLLFVSHHPTFGGPENQALRLDQPLRNYGWETLVVVPDEPGNSGSRLRAGGIDVVTMPLARLRAMTSLRVPTELALRFPGEVHALREMIRARNIDLVVVPGLENPHAAVAARLAKVPVVWQILGSRTPLAFRRTMVPLVRILADAVMITGTRIVAEHPGLSRVGRRLVPFFPPVDTELFAPDALRRTTARAELGLHDDELVIGNVANINRQKDHVTFVRAAATLLADFPRARFVLLGESSPTQESYIHEVMSEASRLGLSLGRQLIVRAPGERVHELAPALDVFWLSSERRSEGVPTAMLEAMALGIPVVASAVGGVADVITHGEGGYLVPPSSPSSLASTTAPLARDPHLREAQGAVARNIIVRRFNLEKCVAAHVRAFTTATAP